MKTFDNLMVMRNRRLKNLRKIHNLTEGQVSDYLEMDHDTYSKLEDGSMELNVDTLDKLCLLYGCSPEYLLGESDEYDSSKIVFNINKNNIDLNIIAKVNETMNYLELLEKLNGV